MGVLLQAELAFESGNYRRRYARVLCTDVLGDLKNFLLSQMGGCDERVEELETPDACNGIGGGEVPKGVVVREARPTIISGHDEGECILCGEGAEHLTNMRGFHKLWQRGLDDSYAKCRGCGCVEIVNFLQDG